jgi:hypothetical protein
MATTWLPADKIDACNDDLMMAIAKVITGNTILTEIIRFRRKIYLN